MARDILTVQPFSTAGLLANYTTATANNDAVVNNGRRVVHVKNGSGGSINVTENIGGMIDGQTSAAKVVPIAAGAEKFFGPWPSSYNQTDGTNQVFIDFSAFALVTRAVLEMPVV